MELGDPSRGDEKPSNRPPSLHYSTSNRTSTKERIGLLSLYSSFFQIKHILSTRDFISLLFPLLLLPLGIVFILVLLFFALLSGHDIFPWSKMRYEGESYKRKIINSYPQDLIPCSASTTESLIDLLPLLHQLSSLGCGSEWRLLVFAVNIRIIRKACANKRDGGHRPMAAATGAVVCQALAVTPLSGNRTAARE